MSSHNAAPYTGTLTVPGLLSSRSSERTLGYDNQGTSGHMKVSLRPTKVSPNWQPYQNSSTEALLSLNSSFRKRNRSDGMTVPEPSQGSTCNPNSNPLTSSSNNNNNSLSLPHSHQNPQQQQLPQSQQSAQQQQQQQAPTFVSLTAPALLASSSSNASMSFTVGDNSLLVHGLDTSTPTSSLKSLLRMPHNINLLSASDRSFPPMLANTNNNNGNNNMTGNTHLHQHLHQHANMPSMNNTSSSYLYGNSTNNTNTLMPNNNNVNNNNNVSRSSSLFMAGTITPVASTTNSSQLSNNSLNIPRTPSYGYYNTGNNNDYYNSPQTLNHTANNTNMYSMSNNNNGMHTNGKDVLRGNNTNNMYYTHQGYNNVNNAMNSNSSYSYNMYDSMPQQQQMHTTYAAHMPKYNNMPMYNNTTSHYGHHHMHHSMNNTHHHPNDALTNALLKKGLKRKKRSTTPMQLKKSKHENAPKRICISCRARQSSYWREPWHGAIACNACTLRYKKRSLACEHCLFIPFKHNDANAVCPSCKLGKFSNPEGRPLPPHIRMLIEPSSNTKNNTNSTSGSGGLSGEDDINSLDTTVLHHQNANELDNYADDDDDHNEDELDEDGHIDNEHESMMMYEPQQKGGSLEIPIVDHTMPMLDIPIPTKLEVHNSSSVPSSYERDTSHVPKTEVLHSTYERTSSHVITKLDTTPSSMPSSVPSSYDRASGHIPSNVTTMHPDRYTGQMRQFMDKRDHLRADLALLEKAALQLDCGYNQQQVKIDKQSYLLSYPDVTAVDSAVASFAKLDYVQSTVTDDMVIFNYLQDGLVDSQKQSECLLGYKDIFDVKRLEAKVLNVIETQYHAHLMLGGGANSARMASLEEEEDEDEEIESTGNNGSTELNRHIHDENSGLQKVSFPFFMPAGRNQLQQEGMSVNAALEYTQSRLHRMQQKHANNQGIGRWMFQVGKNVSYESAGQGQDGQMLHDEETDGFKHALKQHRKDMNQVFRKMGGADVNNAHLGASTTTRDMFEDLDNAGDVHSMHKFPKTSRIQKMQSHLQGLHQHANLACEKELSEQDEQLKTQFQKQHGMKHALQGRKNKLETLQKQKTRISKLSQQVELDPDAQARQQDLLSSDQDRWKKQALAMTRKFLEEEGVVAATKLRREMFTKVTGRDEESLARALDEMQRRQDEWSGEQSDWCNKIGEYSVLMSEQQEKEQEHVEYDLSVLMDMLQNVLERVQRQREEVVIQDDIRTHVQLEGQNEYLEMQLKARMSIAKEKDRQEIEQAVLAPVCIREQVEQVHVFDLYSASTMVTEDIMTREDVSQLQHNYDRASNESNNSNTDFTKTDVLTYEEDPMMQAYLRQVTDSRVQKQRMVAKERYTQSKSHSHTNSNSNNTQSRTLPSMYTLTTSNNNTTNSIYNKMKQTQPSSQISQRVSVPLGYK